MFVFTFWKCLIFLYQKHFQWFTNLDDFIVLEISVSTRIFRYQSRSIMKVFFPACISEFFDVHTETGLTILIRKKSFFYVACISKSIPVPIEHNEIVKKPTLFQIWFWRKLRQNSAMMKKFVLLNVFWRIALKNEVETLKGQNWKK